MGACLSLAFLLCLLTFLFSMIEARWAAERVLTAQRALGVPAAVTRCATAVQSTLPVALGVLFIVPATIASGIAFLAFWGAGYARGIGLWAPTVGLALGALALTAATGWALGRGKAATDILSE